jgi:hypothetical protein
MVMWGWAQDQGVQIRSEGSSTIAKRIELTLGDAATPRPEWLFVVIP